VAPRRARIGVSIVFLVCGAAFATWAARVPAAQERLGLTEGELALGLFGLAAGSVLALLVAGALVTVIGSRRTSIVGATVLCAGLPAVAAAPDLGLFVTALALLGVGNSLLDVAMNSHAARVEDAYGRPIFAGFHAFWNIGGLAGSGLAAGLAAADVPIGVHFPVAGAILFAVALGATTAFLPGADPGAGGPAFSLPGRETSPMSISTGRRVCFVGDSYVAGFGDPEHRGWVGRVVAPHRTGMDARGALRRRRTPRRGRDAGLAAPTWVG
jgi:MFS family permease